MRVGFCFFQSEAADWIDGRTPKAFENASESSADELAKDEIALAASWAKAYEAAKTAGFRALGEADEAYFEVRVE